MADDRDDALGFAFMRSHPAPAARVLESLPATEAAAAFDRVPARVGAGVLAAMLPRVAAQCVAAVPEARGLELLSAMGTQATVSVLRHVPEPQRRRLLAGLPTTSSLASTLLLGYADETLGAWADPDILALPAEARVADALERWRQSDVSFPAVFVTAADRRLNGIVALTALLQAPAAATLATLMRRPGAVLPANAPLSGAVAHPGWEQDSALPVVESGDRLLGVMTRDALTRAQRRSQPPPAPASGDGSLPSLLARGYWQALSGLLAAGLTLLPGVTPVAGDGNGG